MLTATWQIRFFVFFLVFALPQVGNYCWKFSKIYYMPIGVVVNILFLIVSTFFSAMKILFHLVQFQVIETCRKWTIPPCYVFFYLSLKIGNPCIFFSLYWQASLFHDDAMLYFKRRDILGEYINHESIVYQIIEFMWIKWAWQILHSQLIIYFEKHEFFMPSGEGRPICIYDISIVFFACLMKKNVIALQDLNHCGRKLGKFHHCADHL